MQTATFLKGVRHAFAPALQWGYTPVPPYQACDLIAAGTDPRVRPGQRLSTSSRSPGILDSEHCLYYRGKVTLRFLGPKVPSDAPVWSEMRLVPSGEELIHG
jgi:hypothetical protein